MGIEPLVPVSSQSPNVWALAAGMIANVETVAANNE
jgi:hypothetical protein